MPLPSYDRATLLRFALATMRNRLKVDVSVGTLWYRLAETWSDSLTAVSGQQQYIARQILPGTADAEQLDRHAALRGVSRKPAQRAAGLATVVLSEE